MEMKNGLTAKILQVRDHGVKKVNLLLKKSNAIGFYGKFFLVSDNTINNSEPLL